MFFESSHPNFVFLSLSEKLWILIHENLRPHNIQGAKQAYVTFAIGRAYKTMSAILTLCKEGYGEDAFSLSRGQFELAISCLYICQDETETRAEDFINYDWINKKKVLVWFEGKYGFPRPEKPGELTREQISSKVQGIKNDYLKRGLNLSDGWAGTTKHKMAESVGLGEHYKTLYALQCSLQHGDATGANEYMQDDGDSGATILAGPSYNWTREALTASFESTFYIARQWSNLFSIGITEHLEKIEKEFALLIAQRNSKEREAGELLTNQ